MQASIRLTLERMAVVSLLVGIVAAMFLVALSKAYGSEVQVRSTIIFLVNGVCDERQTYYEIYGAGNVACVQVDDLTRYGIPIWETAHGKLWGFSTYYNVVYVVDKVGNNALGRAFYGGEQTWAYAYFMPEVVAHELSHLVCGCFYTEDLLHGSPESGAIGGSVR